MVARKKVCPWCLKPYSDIYTSIVDQATVDIVYMHFKNKDGNEVFKMCGLRGIKPRALAIDKKEKAIHIMVNAIPEGKK
jgi:hypothetical protein